MRVVKRDNRLREFRDRARLTLEEVSAITGFDATTVSKHESGTRGLTEEAIRKYSKLYKCESYELFLRAEEMSGNQE